MNQQLFTQQLFTALIYFLASVGIIGGVTVIAALIHIRRQSNPTPPTLPQPPRNVIAAVAMMADATLSYWLRRILTVAILWGALLIFVAFTDQDALLWAAIVPFISILLYILWRGFSPAVVFALQSFEKGRKATRWVTALLGGELALAFWLWIVPIKNDPKLTGFALLAILSSGFLYTGTSANSKTAAKWLMRAALVLTAILLIGGRVEGKKNAEAAVKKAGEFASKAAVETKGLAAQTAKSLKSIGKAEAKSAAATDPKWPVCEDVKYIQLTPDHPTKEFELKHAECYGVHVDLLSLDPRFTVYTANTDNQEFRFSSGQYFDAKPEDHLNGAHGTAFYFKFKASAGRAVVSLRGLAEKDVAVSSKALETLKVQEDQPKASENWPPPTTEDRETRLVAEGENWPPTVKDKTAEPPPDTEE